MFRANHSYQLAFSTSFHLLDTSLGDCVLFQTVIKQLKADRDTVQNQLDIVTREKETIETRLREIEIERYVCRASVYAST